MKEIVSRLLNKYTTHSKLVDIKTQLRDKHWILVNDAANTKVVYLFTGDDNLIISENGIVTRSIWQVTNTFYLIISNTVNEYLYRIDFLDDKFLRFALDGTDSTMIFVNEPYFGLLQEQAVGKILESIYSSNSLEAQSVKQINYSDVSFVPSEFPELITCVANLKEQIKDYSTANSIGIIIDYAKNHSLKSHYINSNERLCKAVVNGVIDIAYIEYLFDKTKDNFEFQTALIQYLESCLD